MFVCLFVYAYCWLFLSICFFWVFVCLYLIMFFSLFLVQCSEQWAGVSMIPCRQSNLPSPPPRLFICICLLVYVCVCLFLCKLLCSMQLFAGNPILPLLLLAGQQPLELPDGDERADDQQEGGWHDRPAEEGARGEGEIHTEVRRHSEKVALLRRNPVKNHNKGGAGTREPEW